MSHLSISIALVVIVLLSTVSAQNYACGWQYSPPRGWDSYDAFPVLWGQPNPFNESLLLEEAAALSRYNTTGQFNMLVIDEGWAENDMAWTLDMYGRPTVNTVLFPSAADGQGFTTLVNKLQNDYGLKLGLWMIKGIPKQAVEMNLPISNSYPPVRARDIYIPGKVCQWHKDVYWVNASHPGGQAYYDSLVALYSSWGISYLKMDCIFGENEDTDPLEIAAISKSMRSYGNNMLLSLSPGNNANLQEGNQTGRLANLYRVTGDLWDCWVQDLVLCPSGTSIINATYTLRAWEPLLQGQQKGQPYLSIPDPDMIALGEIGLGIAGRHLSWITKPNLARYVYGMWTITKSPIILGGDMRNLQQNLPWLDKMFMNADLAAVSICSGAPSVAFFQDVTKNESSSTPTSAATTDAAVGDGGIIVWTVPHGSMMNAFYMGYFAFSLNATASYSQLISLNASTQQLPFNETISIFYSAYDIMNPDAPSQVVSPFTELVNVTVGANDAAMFLYVPCGADGTSQDPRKKGLN